MNPGLPPPAGVYLFGLPKTSKTGSPPDPPPPTKVRPISGTGSGGRIPLVGGPSLWPRKI